LKIEILLQYCGIYFGSSGDMDENIYATWAELCGEDKFYYNKDNINLKNLITTYVKFAKRMKLNVEAN
jgi:hypothetical protein